MSEGKSFMVGGLRSKGRHGCPFCTYADGSMVQIASLAFGPARRGHLERAGQARTRSNRVIPCARGGVCAASLKLLWQA